MGNNNLQYKKTSLVNDILYPLVGRLNYLNYLSYKKKADVPKESDLDKSGIVSGKAEEIRIRWRDDEIIFPEYDSLDYSLWRAQELSLFYKYIVEFIEPVADFGCGEGTFAALLFQEVDCGIDIDKEALDIAENLNIYNKLYQSTNTEIPLETGSIQTVFSNSVLEHCADIGRIIAEINRILAVGGKFYFAVPVIHFAEDFTKYFGTKASVRVNNQYYHRNLFDETKWRSLLEENGFAVELIHQYQPDWFTFYFWMLKSVIKLGKIFPPIGNILWKCFNKQIIGMVRESITTTGRGGNIFVIAKKKVIDRVASPKF